MINAAIRTKQLENIATPSMAHEQTPSQNLPVPKSSISRALSAPPVLADLPTKAAGKRPQISAHLTAGSAKTSTAAAPATLPRSQSAPAALGRPTAECPEDMGALTFSGQLRIKNGELTSDNETIRNLIHYLGDTAKLFADQPQLDGMQVKIRPNPEASMAYKALEEHCKVGKALVRPGKSPLSPGQEAQLQQEEIEGNALVPLLMGVIERGRDALGANARIEGLDHRQVPIHDFLAALRPRVEVADPELSLAINTKIRSDANASAKLGAETLLQMATQKTFAVKSALASVGVSLGLGATWELWGSHLLKNALFGKGFSPTKFALKLAGIDSVPPLLIETLDTLCVLAAIKVMKGEDGWSLKNLPTKLMGLLPKAGKAGAISAAGSFPNNVLQYKGVGARAANTTLNALTTEAAILSAASGIPLEVKESEANTNAAIVEKIRDGLLALPPLDPNATPEQRAKQLEAHVNTVTKRALAMSPGDGIGQKSMAFAAVVGLIPFVLGNNATKLVSEPVLRIMRSTVFNPIEAIAMNSLVFSSKFNIPGLMTSDYRKHAQTLERILQEASARDTPMQAGDISRIFHRWDGLNRAGSAIVNTMSAIFDALPALGRMAGIGETPLTQRIPYETLARPAHERA